MRLFVHLKVGERRLILRTPVDEALAAIDESFLVAIDEELADGIEVIRNSASSLTQLISDLLDLSRIQRRVARVKYRAAKRNA